MAQPMYDDNAGNVYCKYLEDTIKRQNDIIEELKETVEYYVEINANLDEDKEVILMRSREKSLLISKLLMDNEELKTTTLAAQIQAAESEFRADEEKRAHIQLLMRR